MKNTQKYFSLVSDRINDLQRELKDLQRKIGQTSSINEIKRYQLEADFIKKKINYLNKIVNLPMLLLISNLSQEQVKEMQQEGKIPAGEGKDYLIKAFGLENLRAYISEPKIVSLYSIKDAFLDDFDAMSNLLAMNQRNLELANHRNRLYGIGLNGEVTYLQLSHDEKALNVEAAKVDKTVAKAQEDYNLETLKELSSLINNPNQKLSNDFILRHSKKVLATNPEMKKIIKKLTRKKLFGGLSRFFPTKRNKNEQKFMDAINSYYEQDTTLQELGIITGPLFNQSEIGLENLEEQIQRKCRSKKSTITAKRNHINLSRRETLRQIHEFEAEQKQVKKRFISLVSEKTYFPKFFHDQLWNEPDLKSSLMQEACYLEEKKLIEELTSLLNGQASITLMPVQEVYEQGKLKRFVA